MSFIKQEFTAVECDNCKEIFENSDGVCYFIDQDVASEEATNWGEFTKEGDSHYCNLCYQYDNEDNLILNSERKPKS